MDHPASYFSIFGQHSTPQGEKNLTGSGNTILAWQNFDDLDVPRRAKTRLSASEAAQAKRRGVRFGTLSLRAKQERQLTDFSSILLSLLEAKYRAASM